MNNLFAVIGNPIAHSLSPLIHQLFAEQTKTTLYYEKILGEQASFASQVSNFFASNGKGLNVTAPFKHQAFNLAKRHNEPCFLAQAANTLWLEQDILCADNTDGEGLRKDLSRYSGIRDKSLLILGAGGAVSAIIPTLQALKPRRLSIANRNLIQRQEMQKRFPEAHCIDFNEATFPVDILIHASPVNWLHSPIPVPEALWAQRPFCYDLSYQLSGDTSFVAIAKAQGCIAQDGLGMLIEQAAISFYLWHGVLPDTELVFAQLKKINQRKKPLPPGEQQ